MMRTGLLLISLALFGALPSEGLAGQDRLERIMAQLSGNGSRLAGYEGNSFAADLVEAEFNEAGVANLQREPFEVVVPIDRGASIEVEGQVIELYSLWPNQIRTNTIGPNGLQGKLFYAGQGDFSDFDGHEVEGNIALLEFNTWDKWKNAAAMGVAAVIFVAPLETTIFEARKKWSWAPVDLPRFWLERSAGLALKKRLETGGLPALVQARMDWQPVISWNIWGTIPGTDPQLANELVMVHAYYDGISAVPALNPAASSTASVAALIELAHFFKIHPPARPVALVATGGHFLGQAGLGAFFSHHARRRPLFRERLPKRFVADSLDIERLRFQTRALGMTPDSLGIHFDVEGRLNGVDLARLRAQLKLKRLSADSLGIKLEPDSLAVALFVGLDLSSHSDQLGISQSARAPAHRQFFVPIGRKFAEYNRMVAPQRGRDAKNTLINLVSPPKGVSARSFINADVYLEAGESARDVGLMAINLLTLNDSRQLLDTPLDTFDKVNVGNIFQQSRLINFILLAVLADSALFGPEAETLRRKHDKNITDALVDIRGSLRLMPRRGAVPDQPVPHGLVVVDPFGSFRYWRPLVYQADAEGNYQAQNLSAGLTEVWGFHLDEVSGAIDYATDLGKQAQDIGLVAQSLSKDETQWTTVLFPAEQSRIHERIDAKFLFAYGNYSKDIKILDRRGAPPRRFGYGMGDYDEQMMVLFAPADEALRVVDGSLLLLDNKGAFDEKTALGKGFFLGEHPLIRHAALQSAQDMWRLDEVRIEQMRQHGIENPRLKALHRQAGQFIEKATAARDQLRWGDFTRYTRAALGLEYRAYPDVRGTQNDVIGGLVFFVALLVPAAFFAERLFFASTDIRRQLVLFGLILAIIWTVLSLVHPAFKLAHPAIVLLALLIMAMACFVIGLVMGRFNRYMEDWRLSRAGGKRQDLSRTGTAYVAFMLGISNMRRRVMRTGLTLGTIVLLTFTVLSFTSFKPSIRFAGFEKDWTPSYAGALLHDLQWFSLDRPVLDYLRSHFGEFAKVAPRTWLPAGFDESSRIPLQGAETSVDAEAVLGLSLAEPQTTGIDRALVAGSWFEDAREQSIILSTELGRQLGIDAADLGIAKVEVFGQEWLVRALFDGARYEEIKDLNNEAITPARIKFGTAQMPGMDRLLFSAGVYLEDLEVDLSFSHLGANRLAILPYERLASMDADLMAVAVHFDEGVDGRGLIEAFLTRAGFRLFVGLPDEAGILRAFAYTSLGVTSVEGLGALAIPILIAALIVLNTMLGAVYERFREIGVYSSVGLAPMHIAFLFIAEACVYGVMGVTLGYVLGQGLAKILLAFDLMGGLALNYSSSAAIASAVLVMLVVMVSTFYPARMASQLAVPDVVRRWQLPAPQGDVWRFPFPFTVNRQGVESLCGFLYSYFVSYSHESVGKLYTERTRIVVDDSLDDRQYALQLLVWLAPFDMGVSQYLQIGLKPTEQAQIFELELYIERLSGPLAFWERLNRGFVLGLRQQFLVWQTLGAEQAEEHAQMSRRVAQEPLETAVD